MCVLEMEDVTVVSGGVSAGRQADESDDRTSSGSGCDEVGDGVGELLLLGWACGDGS